MCCYHKSSDQETIPQFLIDNGFEIQMNEGYIFSFSEGVSSGAKCLRKGVVYGSCTDLEKTNL